ncbi:unnamed protein product [Protopolystoma xenopodis]|uniref:Uncharacterized protein n=1 Tax=Protopolystoma xenopodis TaxID=117903 RepID=A0A3S5BD46_9PLAT|nr:unnamed protein product [Protopolystoma xenopodis]
MPWYWPSGPRSRYGCPDLASRASLDPREPNCCPWQGPGQITAVIRVDAARSEEELASEDLHNKLFSLHFPFHSRKPQTEG